MVILGLSAHFKAGCKADKAKITLRTISCTYTMIYGDLNRINIMDTMSYSTFRSQLASVLDKVNNDHKPVLITRQGGSPAVLISLEDFQAYEETAYLMASPKNAQRLNQAIAEIEAGQAQQRELIEA